MNILLIASYFPPDQHMGSFRWARLTTALNRMGFDFSVVAAENSDSVPQTKTIDFSPALIGRIPYGASFQSILRVLSSKSRLVLSASSDAVTQDMVRTGRNNGFITAVAKKRTKELGQLLLAIAGYPDYSWPWGRLVYQQALPMIRNKKIDAIVATHPYPGCLRATHLLSMKTGIPWVADMRDGWFGNYQRGAKERPLVSRRIGKIERDTLDTAEYVVTISPELGRQIKSNPSKLVFIPNSFDPDEYRQYRREPQQESDVTNIVYTGGIKANHDYRVFLDALKHVSASSSIKGLSISYYGKSFSMLEQYAAKIGLTNELLHDHGYVSHARAIEAQCSANLLLVFGWNGEFSETLTTGKVIDYLGAERPIVALCSKDSALGGLISDTGAGVVLSTQKETTSFLNSLIVNREALMASLYQRRREQALAKYKTGNTASAYYDLLRELRKGVNSSRGQLDR